MTAQRHGAVRAYDAAAVYANCQTRTSEWSSRMAQKIQTLFVDDIDGSDAEGTIRFGLDGTDYEIDLSTAHATDLRQALAKFIEAGRKAPGSARRPARTGRKATAASVDTTVVRAWAKNQGIDIKDRGRVPADVVIKYREAAGV
jgi:hypothetical protein